MTVRTIVITHTDKHNLKRHSQFVQAHALFPDSTYFFADASDLFVLVTYAFLVTLGWREQRIAFSHGIAALVLHLALFQQESTKQMHHVKATHQPP